MPKRPFWHHNRTPEPRDPGKPGGQPHVLSDMIGARTRAEVEDERVRADWHIARALRDGEPANEYHEGIANAARWALGELETAPVTRLYTPGLPDADALRKEDDAAYRAIYRAVPESYRVGRIGTAYQVGVQAALMWIRGETEQRAALGIPDENG